MADEPKGDNVGYCKPPKYSQFQKGRSGNPRGRPKGAKGFGAILAKVLEEKFTYGDGSRSKRASILELAVRALAKSALKGNTPALRELISLAQMHESSEANPNLSPEEHKRQQEAIASVIARVISMRPQPDESSDEDGAINVIP